MTQHNPWQQSADLGSALARADVLEGLQRTEPVQKVLVLVPHGQGWERRRLADFLKRVPFHLEIGPRVDLSRFDIRMTEEVANHVERDSTLQQVHAFRVSKRVRTHRSVQTRPLPLCTDDVFVKDVADSRTR